MLLALYDGKSLHGVFPHAAGDRQVSVEDAIVTIETARTPDPTPRE